MHAWYQEYIIWTLDGIMYGLAPRVGEVTLYIKVIYYILLASYFYKEVIYYSHILLYQKSNSIVLLVTFKVIILHNLDTKYWVTPKVYLYKHACRTLFLLRKLDFYEKYMGSIRKVIYYLRK